MFKFSAALLEKESKAFSIIFQKSFRTEMEYISNGKIKVTVFHPRTQKVEEINYFFFLKCSDPDFIHIGSLNFCQVAWKTMQFHWLITVQLYIIFAYCSWTRTIFMSLFSFWFSVSQASLVSTEHHYGLLFSPNTFSSGSC